VGEAAEQAARVSAGVEPMLPGLRQAAAVADAANRQFDELGLGEALAQFDRSDLREALAQFDRSDLREAVAQADEVVRRLGLGGAVPVPSEADMARAFDAVRDEFTVANTRQAFPVAELLLTDPVRRAALEQVADERPVPPSPGPSSPGPGVPRDLQWAVYVALGVMAGSPVLAPDLSPAVQALISNGFGGLGVVLALNQIFRRRGGGS
jgi:hypothetical protein